MTPTLSPQQREEVLEAMARAIMIGRDDGGCIVKDWAAEARDNPHVAQALRQAELALDAALPAIIGAVWREAAERMERHMDTCDVVALTHPDERTIIEYRIKEDAYRDASEEFRALAEKGTKS